MIQIVKASTNIVVLTLTELATLASPVFLFEFKNDQELNNQYFIATDTSEYKSRYNKFSITEKLNPDPLNAEVILTLTGGWSYKVYEQASSTNLNPSLCDNTTPLEAGKVKVTGVEELVNEFDYNPTIKVYNG